MPLFGIAILSKPSKKEMEDGASERLVFGPVWEAGHSEQATAMKVLLAAQQGGKLPADLDLSRAEVQITPFA